MSITARGGYQIVDLKGVVFEISTEEDPKPVSIPGIFAKMVQLFPIKKPILVDNLKYTDGIEHVIIPQFATNAFKEEGTDEEKGIVEIDVGLYVIQCAEDDSVIFGISEGK